MGVYVNPTYPYQAPTDLRSTPPQRRPLIIVGAGPVGLAAAIDARLHNLPVLLLDEDKTVSVGSRAVCYAKRALEILDRLGVGEMACSKGVSWNVGRTFLNEEEVYQFNLVPDAGHDQFAAIPPRRNVDRPRASAGCRYSLAAQGHLGAETRRPCAAARGNPGW